ncbi:MAG: alkaline phosphatase [Clostridia bacterium]|nr:alkaline phosphatase [Clostridia bacterium]
MFRKTKLIINIIISLLVVTVGSLSLGTSIYYSKQSADINSKYAQQQKLIEEQEKQLNQQIIDNNELKAKYDELYELLYPTPVEPSTEVSSVQKLVLMIGDGMGLSHVECAENYLAEGETLNMKELTYSGSVDTKSLTSIENSSKPSDSSAGATALATGTRVYNGYIAMNQDGQDLETITEIAKAQGLGVGIVTTDYLYEATPAVFSSHTDSRTNFVDIRKDQYAGNVDLFLGSDVYLENLEADTDGFYSQVSEIAEGQTYNSGYVYALEQQKIIDAGYTFVTDFNYDTLNEDNLIEEDKIFGAFEEISVSKLQAPQNNSKVNKTPCLSQLTEFAIEWMELHFPNGYFLMIEENNIDVFSENHSTSELRYETGDMAECLLELDRCVGIVNNKLQTSSESYAIIVTGDHSTGSLIESTNREENYGFWSSWHDLGDVPYFVEAPGCDLAERVDNILIFDLMKRMIVPTKQ